MSNTYGNLRTANGDRINLKGGGQLGGVHPAITDGIHRTHKLGGPVNKPLQDIPLRKHQLGGHPGDGAITDTAGTTPLNTNRKAVGMGAIGH